MNDICKTSAARGKAAHRGTNSGPSSSKAPSSNAAASSHSSAAITALSHNTSVANQSSYPSVVSSTSTVPSLISDDSATSPTAPMPPTGAASHNPDIQMLASPAVQVPPDTACPSVAGSLPSLTMADETRRTLSTPSVTAINTLSNPQSKKSKKSTSSSKRRRDALDDGEEARSATVHSSFVSTDIPNSAPTKSTNAASMITLAGAVASLGTSINHQTMTSDTHIANKVQGFINAQDYLSNFDKSLVGEFYAMQPTLASALVSMTPEVAKITLRRRAKTLLKKEEEDLAMSVDD